MRSAREQGIAAMGCPEFRTEREDSWTEAGQMVGYPSARTRRFPEERSQASELRDQETVW
jgi:hypothetical protein